jgi:hypothetical protein
MNGVLKLLCIGVLVAILAPHLPWYMAALACILIDALLDGARKTTSQLHEPSSSPSPVIVLVP